MILNPADGNSVRRVFTNCTESVPPAKANLFGVGLTHFFDKFCV